GLSLLLNNLLIKCFKVSGEHLHLTSNHTLSFSFDPQTSFYDEIFLVPADPADGCSELTDREILQGQVILVERGGCSFVQKARNVEEAGGKAVLIADNAEDNDSQYLDMVTDGSTAKPSIPALFLLGRDGMMIRRSLQRQALPWAVISIPVNVSALASFPFKQPPWTLW
uniref:PA domain-containing protein n=1 Tax=Oreochromis aureus TaxID=47969 RepID=A0AAZ1XG49_OREAU